jgi:hypothetical protein
VQQCFIGADFLQAFSTLPTAFSLSLEILEMLLENGFHLPES